MGGARGKEGVGWSNEALIKYFIHLHCTGRCILSFLLSYVFMCIFQRCTCKRAVPCVCLPIHVCKRAVPCVCLPIHVCKRAVPCALPVGGEAQHGGED